MKREDKDAKVEYSLSEMEDITPVPDLNLPELEAICCKRPVDGAPYFVFQCKVKHQNFRLCPDCKSCGDVVRNGTANHPRVVHDVNIGVNRVDLVIEVPRYRCKSCGTSFSHEFASILDKRRMTRRLYEQIRRDSFARPFVEVASEFGYSEATIRNIFSKYATELEDARGPIVAPKVLGIDEKHIGHVMRAIFVDIETGRLLEMKPNNKEADIIETITSMVDYDKNIQLVTTDMANNYRSHLHICLPHAKIIVDKYHVYQDLYRKITATRAILMKEINVKIEAETDDEKAFKMKQARQLLVNNSYLFKFSKRKLDNHPRRMAVMADVCNTFPEFNHLRLIKEAFERIYDESKSREDAESLWKECAELIPPNAGVKLIAKWEDKYKVKAAYYREIASFKNGFKLWKEEIFNYFDEGCQFTNAASEGTNSMIQRLNAQGSGYGFEHLRAKALFKDIAAGRRTYKLKIKETPMKPGDEGYANVEHTIKSKDSRTSIKSHFATLYNPMAYAEPRILKAVDCSVEAAEEEKSYPTLVFNYYDFNEDFYDFCNDE